MVLSCPRVVTRWPRVLSRRLCAFEIRYMEFCMKSVRYRGEASTNKAGWLFVATATFLCALFCLYPIASSFLLSFQSGRGNLLKFAGLGNIKRLLEDTVFHQALKNTFVYFIFQVPVMIVLALSIASVLNSPKMRFKGFFRTAIFLPCVTSLVAYSVLFRSMFSLNGLVNLTLLRFELIAQPIPWLTDSFWAKVLIIIALTWRWTGYNMMFYLSALQNIDPCIYEAARIDGAGPLSQFRRITIPMLKPIILFTSVMSTIGTLQLFDESMNITLGGTSNATLTISHYIYNVLFLFTPNFGYAATISYVIVFLVAILALIQFKLSGDDNA
ncbi:MAG TPA: sugar ABC transporter permease [Treponemataceae bacterium]|nr:sugar ABC transporter permease [Treponemataceae bacterium]